MASNLGTCKQCDGDLCCRGPKICCMECGLPLEGAELAAAKAIAAKMAPKPSEGGLKSPGIPAPVPVLHTPPITRADVQEIVRRELEAAGAGEKRRR